MTEKKFKWAAPREWVLIDFKYGQMGVWSMGKSLNEFINEGLALQENGHAEIEWRPKSDAGPAGYYIRPTEKGQEEAEKAVDEYLLMQHADTGKVH